MNVLDRWIPMPMFLIVALALISSSTRFTEVMLGLLAAGGFAWWVARQESDGKSSIPEELIP